MSSDCEPCVLDRCACQPAGDAPVAVHRVAIYVTSHCANCLYARELAAVIRRAYPQVVVEVIDLACPQAPVPDSVFAVPTYFLDGRLWSLGNPSVQQIRDAFGALVIPPFCTG